MRMIIAMIVALVFALPASAEVMRVETGLVDTCSETAYGSKEHAVCTLGEFALDYEGNVITDLDGSANSDDDDA